MALGNTDWKVKTALSHNTVSTIVTAGVIVIRYRFDLSAVAGSHNAYHADLRNFRYPEGRVRVLVLVLLDVEEVHFSIQLSVAFVC